MSKTFAPTRSPITLARRAGLAPSSTIRELLAVTERPGMRSLAGGLPDPGTFPVEALREATDRVFTDPGLTSIALQYGPTDGLAELRSVLAAPGSLHGLSGAHPDELVITSGAQQALDLIARVMIDPGDVVVLEDPCYLGARQTFAAASARLVGIPADHHGLDTERLESALLEGLRPRLVYTVANFQNPSGAVLSSNRRDLLVTLAQEYGFVVVEDDPYYALHFGDRPVSSIGNRGADHVITLGSLSKVCAPGLRLGWLRAPRLVREAIVRAKQACDLHTSTFTQLIAAEVLVDQGFLEPHLARIRTTYAARARVLSDALSAAGVRCPRPEGGMFVWVHFDGADTDELLAMAVEQNVAFVPGSAFGIEQPWNNHARLSFATVDEMQLVDAANTLVALASTAAARTEARVEQ